MDFSEAENVGLLNVKDGDIIVLTIPGRLTQQALEGCEYYVRDKLKEYGLNVNVLLLFDGMTLTVIRPEKEAGE